MNHLRRRVPVLICTVLISLFILPANNQAFAAEGTWVIKAPMPSVRDSIMVDSIGEQLYVAGGVVNSCCGFLDTLQAYNSVTDTWASRAPMLEPRAAGGSAV